MTTDEYVPSEKAVRHAYVVIESRRDILAARAEFDRFLARVRRDAAREALDGLARDFAVIGQDPEANDVRNWRDTRYPEETP